MESRREATNQPKGLDKHDKDYGTPVAGSKTEARGKLAHERISREILELCCIINDHGTRISLRNSKCDKTSEPIKSKDESNYSKEDTKDSLVTTIEFGRLFDIYTKISNKLVGVLLRARKYGILDFQGEMLWQRRDDAVIITLLYSPAKVREMLREKTFAWGKCM